MTNHAYAFTFTIEIKVIGKMLNFTDGIHMSLQLEIELRDVMTLGDTIFLKLLAWATIFLKFS